VSEPLKVLHLADPGTPGGGATTLHLLGEVVQRLNSIRHNVLLVGSRGHADLARRCGVEPLGRMSVPRQVPMAGRRSLVRFLEDHESACGRFDLIHAWTARAAVLASMAAPDRKRLGMLAVGPLSDLNSQFMMMLLEQRPMPLLAYSTAVKREYESLGVNHRSVSILHPAVNPASVDAMERDELRERWEVDEDTFIIGLLSEPVSWADARTAMAVVSRVAVTGRTVKLLVHPSAARRGEADRWSRRLERGNLLIVDDEVAEPWRIVNGIDAALLIGGELNSMDMSAAGSFFSLLTGGGRRLRPMPGIMPLLWAMAAGVPVVAEASDAVRDIVEEGRSGLLVRQHDIDTACDRFIRLVDDRVLARRIGANASEHVRHKFGISAYCVRLKDAYERVIAGRTIHFDNTGDDPLVERYDLRTASWTDQ
jgi:hypothetical protein